MAFAKCNCGYTKNGIADEHIGKKAKCPKCGTPLFVEKEEVPDPPQVPESISEIEEDYENELSDSHEPDDEINHSEKKGILSSSDFSLKKHFKHVLWVKTYYLNLIRITACLLLPIIAMGYSLLFDSGTINKANIMTIFLFFIHLLFAPISFILVALFLKFLSDLKIPFIGLISLCMYIPFMIFGDPIVYLIHKVKPSLIPVKNYGLFNHAFTIFVLDETFED